MLLHVFFLNIYSEFISECDLPDYDNVISLYTRKTDQDLLLVFENMSHQYENIVFRNVNCDLCECDSKEYPRLVLSKNKESVSERVYSDKSTSAGDKNKNIAKDYVKTLQKEIEAFLYNNGFAKERKEITSNKGKVREMKLTDFGSLIVNPWLVLFYDDTSNYITEMLEKIAKSYIDKINIGRIHKKEVANHEKMFNIYKYPTIVAFYDELSHKFADTLTYENLQEFANTLIEPVLPELDFARFLELKNTKNTIFIVFYKNKNLAISYFRKISQMYRFISKFYISNDKELIKYAGVSFISRKKNIEPENIVVFSAFRNNTFHHLKLTDFNFEFVNNWTFHSHHPILTKITNHNFYRIFQGLKPVVLLLTENDTYNEDLEIFAEKYHDNKLSTDFVFATLDIHEMHGFVDSLLPGFAVPGLVIHDPVKMLYFADKKLLRQKNFAEYTENIIKMYQNGILEAYPFTSKKSYRYWYIIIIAIIICGALFYLLPSKKKMKRQ